MRNRRLFNVLPLIVVLAGCSVTDFNPFQEDKYVPVGFQTESIVRALSDDEDDIFEAGITRIDDYITGLEERAEIRRYYSSYFGDYAPDGANDIDYSVSSLSIIKTYENNVRFATQTVSESVLNDYLDYTTEYVLKQWNYLPTPATYEVRRSMQVNDEKVEVVTFAEGAYVEADNYDNLFGYGAANYVISFEMGASAIGMNSSDEIIMLIRTSTYNVLNLARNGFVQVSNSFVNEIKLALYEPEDSDVPLYLPIQAREYIEQRAISEIYHTNEVINYLDTPIVIGFHEVINKWSSANNGDYDLEAIPEITEE